MKFLYVSFILAACNLTSGGWATSFVNHRQHRRPYARQCSHVVYSAPAAEQFRHALAILTMPHNSVDRIANEAILQTALPVSPKLSVVLRCQGGPAPSLAMLRRYVGEVYSQLWDLSMDQPNPELPDVVVYPQNLPNTAPESWIHIVPDLDVVISHEDVSGWISTQAKGRGQRFQAFHGDGLGGLQEHVEAMNLERASRKLAPVKALHVHNAQWPQIASAVNNPNVIFMDDEPVDECVPSGDDDDCSDLFLCGARIPEGQLFDSVAVGGTFDGLHFGHRKLLSLAASSVNPITGQLLVGVTVDSMLRRKRFAEFIPPYEDRAAGVRAFLHRLAPGMKNNIKIVPISDTFGPPGKSDLFFDALVLSHETLGTGYQLNEHRLQQGMLPLTLLCTRRTEAHGMSSTALRRLRSQNQQVVDQLQRDVESKTNGAAPTATKTNQR
jgi:cytidyltransferase-like protein